MQKTIKFSFALLMTLAAVFVAVIAYQSVTVATKAAAQEAEVGTQPGQTEETTADYTYKAQPGDTYTQIARKAIQTYGIDNNVNLTQGGIIFAETNLTQEAAAGELEVGQEVKVDANLVKKWASAAGKLSEAEQAAWNVYVPFVNFNTDNVGQSN